MLITLQNLSKLLHDGCVKRSVSQAWCCWTAALQARCKATDSSSSRNILNRLPHDPDIGVDMPVHVYEGKNHRLGLRLYVWGTASTGALGRESFLRPDTNKRQYFLNTMKHPHRLDLGELYKVVDVSCGYGFTTFALNTKNRPSCFGTGLNKDGQLGYHDPRKGAPLEVLARPVPIPLPLQQDERITKVSCGRAHTLALSNTGVAYAFGSNAYGQCGRAVVHDEDFARQTTYTKLEAVDGPVKQIECGQDTSFLLSTSGSVYSCGWGADGQHGRGHYRNEPSCEAVGGDLQGEKVLKVASRADCVLALGASGDVFGWGNNEYQQLNMACAEPQLHTPRRLALPRSLGRVVDVGATGTSCYVINERGELYSWGYGTLGRGVDNIFSMTPQLISPKLLGNNAMSPGAKAVSISCGVHIAACINDAGGLYTWGKNKGGCLGQGHEHHQDFPIRVCLSSRVLKVSCGVDHMAAITRE